MRNHGLKTATDGFRGRGSACVNSKRDTTEHKHLLFNRGYERLSTAAVNTSAAIAARSTRSAALAAVSANGSDPSARVSLPL